MKGRPPTPRGPVVRLVLATSVALAGCGGGNSLLLPVEDTVFQYEQQFTTLERFRVFSTDFVVPEAGTLHIRVDWSSASDDIDLFLSNPACDAVAFAANLCKVLAAEQTNLKPARLTLSTTATSYRLFVFNRGPSEESGTIVVTVTQSRLAL